MQPEICKNSTSKEITENAVRTGSNGNCSMGYWPDRAASYRGGHSEIIILLLRLIVNWMQVQ